MTRQESFSTLWGGYVTNSEAMKARNKRAKELKASGYRVKCWALRNQVKDHSFYSPTEGVCNVYLINAITL